MTDAILNKCIALRTKLADEILAQPWNFKVCGACLSVVDRTRGICPHCNAYRFSEDLLDVVFAARIVLNTPYPRTEATIPRF